MPIIKRDADYAVRALVRLARTGGLLPVSALAQAERVSEVFLKKIMQKLAKRGIVKSQQGPAGGYRLDRTPADITIREVVEATQGPIMVNQCFVDAGICEDSATCSLRCRLAGLQDNINAWLDDITVADVAGRVPARKGIAS